MQIQESAIAKLRDLKSEENNLKFHVFVAGRRDLWQTVDWNVINSRWGEAYR